MAMLILIEVIIIIIKISNIIILLLITFRLLVIMDINNKINKKHLIWIEKDHYLGKKRFLIKKF